MVLAFFPPWITKKSHMEWVKTKVILLKRIFHKIRTSWFILKAKENKIPHKTRKKKLKDVEI